MILGQALRLRQKSRIKIRDACVLIGVSDEQGVLEENEIFVQIEYNQWQPEESSMCKEEMKKLSKAQKDKLRRVVRIKDNKSRMVVPGPVIITKNPCVHPGDIRKVRTLTKEVDAERFSKLSHLYNVVVFPTKGERPLQNMMSGGDLDGDVYMVIWDEQLVAALQDDKIEEPAPVDSTVKTSEDELEGISENIAHFLKNDYLGKLSNMHTAWCD